MVLGFRAIGSWVVVALRLEVFVEFQSCSWELMSLAARIVVLLQALHGKHGAKLRVSSGLLSSWHFGAYGCWFMLYCAGTCKLAKQALVNTVRR